MTEIDIMINKTIWIIEATTKLMTKNKQETASIEEIYENLKSNPFNKLDISIEDIDNIYKSAMLESGILLRRYVKLNSPMDVSSGVYPTNKEMFTTTGYGLSFILPHIQIQS